MTDQRDKPSADGGGRIVGDADELGIGDLDESTMPGPASAATIDIGADGDMLALLDAVGSSTSPDAGPAASAPAGSGRSDDTSRELEERMTEALLAMRTTPMPAVSESTDQDLSDAMDEAMAALTARDAAALPDQGDLDDAFGLFESMPAAPSAIAAALPEQPRPSAPAAVRAESGSVAAALEATAIDVAAPRDHGPRVGAIVLELARLLTALQSGKAPRDLLTAAARSVAQAIAAAEPPFALRWSGPVVHRDDVWVVLPPEPYEAGAALGEWLARAGCGGLEFRETPDAAGVLALGEALLAGGAPAGSAIGGLPKLPNRGAEERAHGATTALIELGDRLRDDPGTWPVDAVVSALDALEQALGSRPGGVLRALWLDDVPRGAGHAAAEGVALATLCGVALGISPATHRAVAHACFALGLTGTYEQPPPPLREAASLAATRIDAALRSDDGLLDPHQLRVAALLGAAARGDRPGFHGSASGWLDLLHRLNRARHERRDDAPLLDVLLDCAGPDDEAWVRALTLSVGGLPVGTPVRLEGDALAVVVEARGDAILVDREGSVTQVTSARPLRISQGEYA